MNRDHYTEYVEDVTKQCERALVTILGSIGLWREHIVLVGGLVPRYLIRSAPDAPAHIGTADVDLALTLAVQPDEDGAYYTLANNLRAAGFSQSEPAFRWVRESGERSITVELLGESDSVEAGRIFRPKGRSGSGLSICNMPGMSLAAMDFIEVSVQAERLDGGGLSAVTVRVANLLPYVVLKVRAFQDRHAGKDAYDLIFTILNFDGGARAAGTASRGSPIFTEALTKSALATLSDRFGRPELDGPVAYGQFLSDPADNEDIARRRQEAVATISAFIGAIGQSD